MSWEELLDQYLESRAAAGLAQLTLEGRRRRLERFAAFCRQEGVEEPGAVEAGNLAAYQRHLLWTPGARGRLPAPSTVLDALAAVRAFFRWAVAGSLLFLDPARGLRLPRPPRPLPRLLTVAEAEALLEAPDPATPLGLRDRAVLETFYGTALRKRECQQLDLGDLDLRARALAVRRGKGGRPRRVPVGERLAAALERYLVHARPVLARPSEPALWVSRRGGRLGYGALGWVVAHYSMQALGRAVRPHAIRHACATHMLEGGADLRHLQELLGHADLEATQLYTHVCPVELAREHRRTHPRARRRRRRPWPFFP